MEPWTPELHVTPELASTLIHQQFPELSGYDITLLDSGWDNVVYRVGGEYLFRFPQREFALEGVQREMACLPGLSKWIGGVPEIQFMGTPSEQYSWPFFGYVPVLGSEACDVALTLEDRARLAPQLGQFLAKLHSDQTPDQLNVKLPLDPVGRLDFEKRIPMTEERLTKLKTNQIALPYERLHFILSAAQSVEQHPLPRVVHGDLHFRHIMVSDNHELTGLIDWGDIHLNDPAVDLQVYWSFFPPEARPLFANAYGAISDEQHILARSFAVFVNVALLEYALDQHRAAIISEAQWALENILLD